MRHFLVTGSAIAMVSLAGAALAGTGHAVSDQVVKEQRAELAHATEGKGFGP